MPTCLAWTWNIAWTLSEDFRVKIFFAALICIWVTSALGQDLKFDGLRDSDQTQILSEFKKRLKDKDLRWTDEIVRLLTQDGRYLHAEVYQTDTGSYLIRAESAQVLSQVVFLGLKSVDEIDALNAVGLKTGTRLDSGQFERSETRLRELYGRAGYFSPDIAFDRQAEPSGDLILKVALKENQPCRISDVKINSVNPELQARLVEIAKGYRKKIFSEKTLGQLEVDLNEFIKDKRYLSARLEQKEASYNSEKTSAVLVYDVTDPYSFAVEPEGNQAFSRADLLRFADLDSFEASFSNPSSEIAERIRRGYLERGFANVKLTFEQVTDQKSYVKAVKLTIDEGPRIRLKSIEVLGRLSRPPAYYSKFILENSTDPISRSLYVVQDLEVGYKNLVTELNNQGFLRAQIQSSRVEFSQDNTKAALQVLLDEGPLTQIKDIQVLGQKQFKEAEVVRLLGLTPNSPLRLNQLEVGLEAIKAFYRNHGHIEMEIVNEKTDLVSYDERGFEANLKIQIKEGPQVVVREIIIEGNTFTKDYVVLNEIDIQIGDLLTPEKIDEAQRRLDRMNLFSRVEIRTLEANSSVAARALLITVTERNPGSLRMGVGVTNKRELTARGFLGLSYTNLFGTARSLSFRVLGENNLAQGNYPEYEMVAGYLEPFLFGSKFRGRVNLSREEKVEKYEENPGPGLPITNTVRATNRLGTLVERDITSKIRFTWNFWTLETVKLFQDPGSLPGFDSSQIQIATIGPLIDVDYRDNPFLPTKGTFTRLEADYSTPKLGSSDSVEFYRVQGTFTYYQRIGSPRFVWANSARAGYGKNLSDLPNSGIPLSYAFFLGGFTTIRGYSGVEDDRIPSSTSLGITRSADQLVVPDDTNYALFKSEFRYPIYGILGGVVFYDAGRVDIRGLAALENDPNPLKQGAGVGIRVNTPMGPLSVDYARKLTPLLPGESPDHLHISFGTF
jgi:outer membrane protein insertion porin family